MSMQDCSIKSALNKRSEYCSSRRDEDPEVAHGQAMTSKLENPKRVPYRIL